ncbi:O-antigen ligase family protein [Sulfurospirillum halorespirans]|uniref:Putative polysaccharide polymerase n=1 Tax=Sulfurospirillum halorespirans DSM 13726 TaxID=1193502 RepID=A0A1D7TLX8_9BACT|nr:O-antigen ligase family protein [Sulfurospirillum halorespirans]AOO66003.1 putative polysaccharide polymerase [Sulfurospirillum halorespirans DSM 13726]
MAINRDKILEYLFYLLSLSFFIGKSYKAVTGVIVLVFLIDVIVKRRWDVFNDPIFIALACWCSYIFSSALWAVNPYSAMSSALQVFLWCLLYVAIKSTFITKAYIDRYIRVQMIVILFIVANALIQFIIGFNLFGTPIQASRVTDLFGHNRIFAYSFPLWIGFFGALLALKGQRTKEYLLYGVVLMGMLLTIPLSGARGPLLLLAIFLPFIAWVSPYRKWAFMALGSFLVISAVVVSMTPQLQARILTLAHPFEDQKHTRVSIWLTAFEEFKDNPILGVGFKNFRDRQFEYYKDSFESHEINPKTGEGQFHAHSPWMDILAEQGLVGIAFALFLLFTIAKIVYRSGSVVLIGSMGVWYSFSLLNSGFSLSSGTWSFFMILSISVFAMIFNYQKAYLQEKRPYKSEENVV